MPRETRIWMGCFLVSLMGYLLGATINGELKGALFEQLSSDPTATEARVYYNTTSDVVKYRDGSAWKIVGATPAAGNVYSDGTSLASSTYTAKGNYVLGVNSGATGQEFKALSVGTTGSDFAISHSSGAVAFNLPDAGASARGAVTTGTQTLAGAKTFNTSPLTLSADGPEAVVADSDTSLTTDEDIGFVKITSADASNTSGVGVELRASSANSTGSSTKFETSVSAAGTKTAVTSVTPTGLVVTGDTTTSGKFYAAAGTELLPPITFTADSDTGLYASGGLNLVVDGNATAAAVSTGFVVASGLALRIGADAWLARASASAGTSCDTACNNLTGGYVCVGGVQISSTSGGCTSTSGTRRCLCLNETSS